MGPRLDVGRRAVALATAVSFALTPAAPLAAAPAQAPAAPPAVGPPAPKPTAAQLAKPAPTPAPAAAPNPTTGAGRARYATPSGGKIIVYQPQVASWDQQKHMVAYSAVSYEPKGAPKPALGSLKIEADTKVSVSERLVSFKDIQITESNFPTLPKEQMREVVAEIDRTIPDEERVIALDRVLASVDRSQIIPKDVPGVKADPPTIFFSQTPAVLVNIDGEPIWSPIKENDLKFAVNTNWDLFQHGPTKASLPAQRRELAAGRRPEGILGRGRQAARELREAPRRRQLEGRQGGAARKEARRRAGAPRVREHRPRGDDPPRPASRATSRWWARRSSGSATPTATCSASARRAPSTTSWPGAGSALPASTGPGPSPPRPCPRTSRRSRSSTRARACWPPCRHAAGRGGVLLAQIPQTARVNKKQAQGARGRVPGRAQVREGREDEGRARRQHRQEHHQGRRHVLHVLRGRVVHGQQPERPLDGGEQGAGRDLRDPDQLARPQRHLRDRRGRRRRVGHLRDRGDVHGRDGGVGLRGLGQRLVLPAVLRRLLRRLSDYYGYYPTYGYRASYNPWTGAYSRGVSAYGPTAGPASARATTRGPAPTRAAPPPTGLTARAPPARPTTRARAPTARRARARTCTGAGAARRSSAATSGRHGARDQQHDGDHDAGHADERRRRGGHPATGPAATDGVGADGQR